MRYRLALVAACSVLPAVAFAQTSPPQSIQNVPQHLDAGLYQTTETAAGTYTLSPRNGEYVYWYETDLSNCEGTSAVTAATPITITTSNMQGLAYQLASGPATTGSCGQSYTNYPGGPYGLKASAPGPVTITIPTLVTNQNVRFNVEWNSAP